VSGLGAAGSQPRDWRRWRWPLRLALLAVAVNLIGLNIEWLRLKREADTVRQSMTQTFRSAYPNQTTILDPVAQMRQNIARAKRQHRRGGARRIHLPGGGVRRSSAFARTSTRHCVNRIPRTRAVGQSQTRNGRPWLDGPAAHRPGRAQHEPGSRAGQLGDPQHRSQAMSLATNIAQYRERAKALWLARTEQERRFLAIGGAVVLLALLYLILVDPAVEGRAQLRRSLPQLRQQAAELQAMAQEAGKLAAAPAPRSRRSRAKAVNTSLSGAA
jgi:hypothetical protein